DPGSHPRADARSKQQRRRLSSPRPPAVAATPRPADIERHNRPGKVPACPGGARLAPVSRRS
ncbi:MAG: hypothetical protein KDE20_10295, partial [Caldilineaceae bacterium]|nr:hypothetical protein [Caldilineaceae bacterium]